MQPRLQNGACSGTSGLPQSGHFFGLSAVLGIPAGHGQSSVAAQADGAAKLAAECLQPRRMLVENRNDGRVSNYPLRAWSLERRAAKQRSRFERSAILRQFD